jgi:hypothetical protein
MAVLSQKVRLAILQVEKNSLVLNDKPKSLHWRGRLVVRDANQNLSTGGGRLAVKDAKSLAIDRMA